MKSLSTYLKDNSLNERLIINKNFKGGKANIEFYDKFSNFFYHQSLTLDGLMYITSKTPFQQDYLTLIKLHRIRLKSFSMTTILNMY